MSFDQTKFDQPPTCLVQLIYHPNYGYALLTLMEIVIGEIVVL